MLSRFGALPVSRILKASPSQCFNISKCFCPHCPNSLARPSPGYEWLAESTIVPALQALLKDDRPSVAPLKADDCGASDANLLFRRQRICASLTQQHTAWCGDSWKNVSKEVAREDWPSQATYMHDMLAALASPATCLNTSYARETVAWMNTDMANQTLSGSLMWTWLTFQVSLSCACLHAVISS